MWILKKKLQFISKKKWQIIHVIVTEYEFFPQCIFFILSCSGQIQVYYNFYIKFQIILNVMYIYHYLHYKNIII